MPCDGYIEKRPEDIRRSADTDRYRDEAGDGDGDGLSTDRPADECWKRIPRFRCPEPRRPNRIRCGPIVLEILWNSRRDACSNADPSDERSWLASFDGSDDGDRDENDFAPVEPAFENRLAAAD